jgi:hypothetical protein
MGVAERRIQLARRPSEFGALPTVVVSIDRSSPQLKTPVDLGWILGLELGDASSGSEQSLFSHGSDVLSLRIPVCSLFPPPRQTQKCPIREPPQITSSASFRSGHVGGVVCAEPFVEGRALDAGVLIRDQGPCRDVRLQRMDLDAQVQMV